VNKKLEIGINKPRFEGWDSVSLPKFNIITDNLPYDDNSLNEIYWSHVIEHIPYCNIESVVTQIYNKLEKGGKFRTVCPDMRKIVEAYINDDVSQFEVEHIPYKNIRPKNHWGSLSMEGIYPKLGVGGMFMAQIVGSSCKDTGECFLTSPDGDVYGVVSHVAGWDYEMLKNLLYLVGFSKVERTKIETKDPHQEGGQLCVNAYK